MKFRLLEPVESEVNLESYKPDLMKQLPDRMAVYKSRFYTIAKNTAEDDSIKLSISGAYLPTPREWEAVNLIFDFAINRLPLSSDDRHTVADLKATFPDLLYAAEYPERISACSFDTFISLASERNFVYEGIGIPDHEVKECAIIDIAVLTAIDLKCLNHAFKLLENYSANNKLTTDQIKIISHRKANLHYVDEFPLELVDCGCTS